jgi:hypothetical protein
VLGTLAGLDLPGLGASPLIKTILVEYDWFDDSGHTHRPTAQVMDSLVVAFSREGIQLINDYGQGSAPFDGGNLISDADGDVDGFGSEHSTYKAANFASNRNGYFHYAMHPHSYNDGLSSGYAEVNGDDLINSTLNFYGNYQAVAGTIMHEIGHNLGLRHGGNESANYKPNYNSVMSYQYQFSGVDNNCTIPGNGVLAYSHGTRPSLNENALDEADGICEDAAPVNPLWWTDWNYDGDGNDTGATNIDGQWLDSGSGNCRIYGKLCVVPTSFENTDLTVLTDHDDWANLVYMGIFEADGIGRNREIIWEADVEDIMMRAREVGPPIDEPLTPNQVPTRRPGNQQ